jgi:hypothetical protein
MGNTAINQGIMNWLRCILMICCLKGYRSVFVHSLIICNNVYKVIICTGVTVMNLGIDSCLIANSMFTLCCDNDIK